MSLPDNDARAMAWLLPMPFLSPGELANLTALPASSAYLALQRLHRAGLITAVHASTPGLRPTRRYSLTAWGLQEVAERRGVSVDSLLRLYPVSAHWVQLLLARLDAVAMIYHLVASLADVAAIQSFRWYRKAPLDAGIEMEDGRTIGVMREGPMSPSSHLLRRLRSLQQGAYPRTLLVLAHDPVRLTEWRRTLDRSPFTAFLALQDEVLHSGAGEAIWRSSFDPRPLPLDQVVRFARRDALPLEPPFAGGPCRPTTLKTPLRS